MDFTGGLVVQNAYAKKQTNKKRMYLPTLGTWVRSLIWEDSTCGRATSLRARTTEACVYLEPVLHSKRSHHSEKPTHHNWRTDPAHRNWKEACALVKTQHSHK